MFLISFLDTLIVIGAFFPASFFVMAAGYFALHTNLDFALVLLVVTFGGLVGDLLSYYIGKKGINITIRKKKLSDLFYIEKGKRFIDKYGDKSIILGRFLGVIKSVIPFIAGISKMPIKKFFTLNLIAGIIWSIIHLGIGYGLGKTFEYFYVPKSIEFMVVFLPFLIFFAWTLFEYRNKFFNIFKFLKKSNGK